jgi:hypothetical protein
LIEAGWHDVGANPCLRRVAAELPIKLISNGISDVCHRSLSASEPRRDGADRAHRGRRRSPITRWVVLVTVAAEVEHRSAGSNSAATPKAMVSPGRTWFGLQATH